MTLRFIVFDFDGTIADTRPTFIQILNGLAGEFGYEPVNEDEARQLRHLSSEEIVRQSKLSPFKIPFLLRRAKRELNKEISQIAPIWGMDKALEQLKQEGYELGIVTSNSQENVIKFLAAHQLEDLFCFISSGTTIFGKHKLIQQFLRCNELVPSAMLYVGDETRDIEAARRCQVPVIAVTWGFNSTDILTQYRPDGLAHHPQELLQVIQKAAIAKNLTPT
ncbi:HAD-IA family hydrolase [Spirulina subsalsa FACHB-351]|uniref:HAD-IA family hydrolase n=1 Tax=Spirulina subsalsa FACHB-351 TaxID=234711 RepID=A0ABT3L2K7_9CYAN|nr:HAD-IA family hydrolase [Spirulina subsalsa]MCW6035746.1 HAD-IA family hydrolase [Spirulina subsalsa FACHB-351]